MTRALILSLACLFILSSCKVSKVSPTQPDYIKGETLNIWIQDLRKDQRGGSTSLLMKTTGTFFENKFNFNRIKMWEKNQVPLLEKNKGILIKVNILDLSPELESRKEHRFSTSSSENNLMAAISYEISKGSGPDRICKGEINESTRYSDNPEDKLPKLEEASQTAFLRTLNGLATALNNMPCP